MFAGAVDFGVPLVTRYSVESTRSPPPRRFEPQILVSPFYESALFISFSIVPQRSCVRHCCCRIGIFRVLTDTWLRMPEVSRHQAFMRDHRGQFPNQVTDSTRQALVCDDELHGSLKLAAHT